MPDPFAVDMLRWWSPTSDRKTPDASGDNPPAQSGYDSSDDEDGNNDVDELLELAQRCTITHRYRDAVALLERAAYLGSSEACLSLGNYLLYSDRHRDPAVMRKVASWFTQGLALENAKPSPFATAVVATNGNNRCNLASIAESEDEMDRFNLEIAAHLASGLCNLYRMGKLSPPTGDEKGKGKDGYADVYRKGAAVAARLLSHPALIRRQDAFQNGKDHEVWVPANIPAASHPHHPSAHVLTSTQQLRRSIYASLCYILALVTFADSDASKDESVAWFNKVTALSKESGGPGTPHAEELVKKARERLDMIEFSRQKELELQAHVQYRQHVLVSPLDLQETSRAEKRFDWGAPIDDQPAPKTPSLSTFPTPANRSPKVPRVTRRGTKFVLHDTSAIDATDAIGTPPTPPSNPVPFPARSTPSPPPFPTKDVSRGHMRSKSSLSLLGSRAKSLKPVPSTSSLSAELIGIPPSSLRNRTMSTSLLSSPELSRSRSSLQSSVSSASIYSLPHLPPTSSDEGSSLRRLTKKRSILAQAIMNSLSEMLPSVDDREEIDFQDAAGALKTILRRDLWAEEDLKQWQSEYETDEESLGQSLAPSFETAATPPVNVPKVQLPSTPVRSLASSASSFTQPSNGLRPPAPTPRSTASRCERDRHPALEMDPLLAALEAASKINVQAKCAVCAKRGTNFPACRQCSMVYCSRACRTAAQSCGHMKR